MADSLNAFSDFYSGMLEADPNLAYMGQVAGTDFSGTKPMKKRAKDYFAKQFGNVYNQYLGQLGTEYKQGTDPSKQTTFTQFLEQQPFTERYASLSPYQRGVSTSRFAPSTRFIFY